MIFPSFPARKSFTRIDETFSKSTCPPALRQPRFAPSSNSGGIFRDDGRLYVTGHDDAAVYVLRLPSAGPILEWIETAPAPFAGQGISSDPGDPQALWGIIKATRQVVVGRRGAP